MSNKPRASQIGLNTSTFINILDGYCIDLQLAFNKIDTEWPKIRHEWSIVSGMQTITSDTWTEIGVIQFDPTEVDIGVLNLQVILEASTSRTAYFRMYNLTDGYEVTTMDTTSNVPIQTTIPLTLGSEEFPLASKLYSIQIKVDNTSGAAICKLVKLETII